MSKPQDVYDSIYGEFLSPSAFNQNLKKDRKSILGVMYLKMLSQLAINRFKWEGLPDTVDVRFMELTLAMRGLSVFYHDDEYERYMALRGAPSGQIDMMDNPTMFTVIGNLMLSKMLSVDECVPIWSNTMRIPDYDIITVYAGRLAEADMSIDMTIVNSRHPVLLVGDDNLRLSLTNIYRQVQEGQPMVGVYKSMGDSISDNIQSFDLGVKATDLQELQIAKTRIFNECMTYLGINNANQDKKERLVADEVGANDSQIYHFREIYLNTRRQAAEKINAMYGLNVSVEWDEEPVDPVEDEPDGDEEGDDDGSDNDEAGSGS